MDRFGCFGKLPVSREFLVDAARELADSRLDRWIGEGLGLAKLHLGQRFDARVSAFPLYRFLWGGGHGGKVLAGRMAPSEDGAGRKHPFAIFACLDGRRAAGAGPLLPVLAYELRGEIDDLARSAAASDTPARVTEMVRQARPSVDGDGRELKERYDRFVAESTGGAFWSALLGADDPPLRYQVMQALVETLGPMQGRNPGDIRIGIRFPLSTGDPGRTALEVAFWLDLTARRLGKSLDRASCFWTEAPGNGGAEPAGTPALGAAGGPTGGSAPGGDLYLFFSEPSGPQWTCLVERDADIETVSFLDRPYGSDPAARMEPALRTLLDEPARPLAEYLQWAKRPGSGR